MRILGASIGAVSAEFVERLRADRTQESETHDYKAVLPDSRNDEAKADFARSVTAFANTQGGVLVYGLDAPKRGEWTLPGLPGFNYDERINSLDQVLASKCDPRLPRLTYREVVRGDAPPLLLVGVPRSLGAPHAVMRPNAVREFWRRGNLGNYPMTSREIRDAFLEADRWLNEATEFHINRLKLIISGNLLAEPSEPAGALILHVLPLGRLRSMSVQTGTVDRYRVPGLPWSTSSWSRQPILEGVLRRQEGTDSATHHSVLHYRSGAVEVNRQLGILVPGVGYHPDLVDGGELEVLLVGTVHRAVEWLTSAEVSPPYSIHLSLHVRSGSRLVVNRQNYNPQVGQSRAHAVGTGFDRNAAIFQALIVETSEDLPRTLRTMVDLVWQAAGNDGSPFSRPDGSWELQTFYDRVMKAASEGET